jgi:class 3 adenylate cyclase
MAAMETEGAVLFADLPGYSKLAHQLDPVECAYLVNHFFAWFEREAGRLYGGLVDKFIGDEVMVVFPEAGARLQPLMAAMQTARALLAHDHYGFNPKIGIAFGELAIALVGTQETATVSAMGQVVNLAARCSGSAEPHSIRIATDHIQPVQEVFSGSPWEVQPPELFEPRHMAPVHVVDVRRTTRWEPAHSYLDEIKERVKEARMRGAIRPDKSK